MGRFLSAATPGTIDSAIRIWKGTGKPIVTPSGRTYDWRSEMFNLGGTKWQVYNSAQALQSQTAGFESNRREATSLFNGPFTNRGSVNPDDVYDGYKQANARRKQLTYEMRQYYLGSKSLGLTQAEAIQAMQIGYGTQIREVGLGNEDLSQIISGKYLRLNASKPALANAFVNYPERYKAYMKAWNEAPAVEDISK